MPAINLRPSKTGRNMEKISGKEKLHAVNRLMQYVFKYYAWQFVLVVLLIIVATASGAIGSYFVGTIVVDQFVANKDLTGLAIGVGYMAIIYVAGIVSLYFYNFLMSVVGQGVQKHIRDDLFSHMEDLPVSYFDSRSHGDIMSVYTNDVDALREILSRALPMVVSSLVSMVFYFVMMILTDLIMTAIVIAFAILIFFISKYYAKMSSRYFIEQQISLGKTNGYIEEMTNGQRVVKVFNYEKRNIEGFKKLNDELYRYGTTANRFANVLMPTVNQLGNLQYVIVGLVGSLSILNNFSSFAVTGPHLMTAGIIISFLLYSKSFVQPIGQVSQQLNVAALAIAGASRIFKVIDEPVEKDEGYVELVNAKVGPNGEPLECQERTGKWAWKHPHKAGGEPVSYVWLKGKITMDDVDFGYVPNKIVLHDVSLYAEPGQKVAFVGPTGAGKTTITNLLNRFYDIADGKIRYDDININKIKKHDLRRSLGMVLQDTKLFSGTVKENIRFGNLEASDEDVVKAAKLANADSFISLLPQGYDTVLKNGGASLSQGQRQLIAIARAAVADPPVMILDEATSSIDSRTEKLVQEGMDAIMKGRTVFVIAHRLSTVQNSDVIMVLDQGKIIERGSHADLMAKKGKYYQLYTGSSEELQ
jgi:ATP-binding cassette subfamily B multidrug efflux pump